MAINRLKPILSAVTPIIRENRKLAIPRSRTAHAVNGRHLAFVERFHDQCAQHAGDDLVTEAADGIRTMAIYGYW